MQHPSGKDSSWPWPRHLGAVWSVLWAGRVVAGAALPVGVEVFRVVAALDLTILVPVLVGGGCLFRRRRPWGYVLGAAAGVMGSGYLLVLARAPWSSSSAAPPVATVLLPARPQRRVTSTLDSTRTTDGREPT